MHTTNLLHRKSATTDMYMKKNMWYSVVLLHRFSLLLYSQVPVAAHLWQWLQGGRGYLFLSPKFRPHLQECCYRLYGCKCTCEDDRVVGFFLYMLVPLITFMLITFMLSITIWLQEYWFFPFILLFPMSQYNSLVICKWNFSI